MTNTSATGGVLLPNNPPAPQPLEGQALLRFLQQWLSSVSGLDGKLFLPRWQTDPPNLPKAATAWAAVGISERKSDIYPYVGHTDSPALAGQVDVLMRNEELTLLASFYDMGAGASPGQGGLADLYASQLRDGLSIAQNLEVLTRAGFAFVQCGEMRSVPSLLKQRWLYRVDMPITVRRQITRNYPVRTINEAEAELVAQPVGSGPNIIIDIDAINPGST